MTVKSFFFSLSPLDYNFLQTSWCITKALWVTLIPPQRSVLLCMSMCNNTMLFIVQINHSSQHFVNLVKNGATAQ